MIWYKLETWKLRLPEISSNEANKTGSTSFNAKYKITIYWMEFCSWQVLKLRQ